MKKEFTTEINGRENIEIENDENIYCKQVTICWTLEVVATTSCANIRIEIKSVDVHAHKLETDEPMKFGIAAENCIVDSEYAGIGGDIFPGIIKINSESKTAVINF